MNRPKASLSTVLILWQYHPPGTVNLWFINCHPQCSTSYRVCWRGNIKGTWELGFGRFPIKCSYARPVKLRASGMRVCICKDDKVSNSWNNCIYPDRTSWCLVLFCLHTQASDETIDSLEQDNFIGYQVTFRHLEVPVNNKKISKMLKSKS